MRNNQIAFAIFLSYLVLSTAVLSICNVDEMMGIDCDHQRALLLRMVMNKQTKLRAFLVTCSNKNK